jgi:hypothetical protein
MNQGTGTNPPNEGAWAVLTAVREIQLATAEAFEASKAREPAPEGAAASALGAMARIMDTEWPPGAQYQAIALLASVIRVWSVESGRSEDEIMTELESNYPHP